MSWQKESRHICQREWAKATGPGQLAKGDPWICSFSQSAADPRDCESEWIKFWQVTWPLCHFLSVSLSLFFSLILKSPSFPVYHLQIIRNHILHNVSKCGNWGHCDRVPFISWGNNWSEFFFKQEMFLCLPSFQSQMLKWNEKTASFQIQGVYFAKSQAWGRKVVSPFLYEKGYFNLLNHDSLATFSVYSLIRPITSERERVTFSVN